MWFLIKGAFWFSLGLVALSFFNAHTKPANQNQPDIQVTDAFSAATEAYHYVSAICSEKPDVCVKGAETFTALGHRAREGALVAYEFLDKQFAAEAPKTIADAVPLTAAPSQPMPKITVRSAADDIMTGTIVPLPMKKPTL